MANAPTGGPSLILSFDTQEWSWWMSWLVIMILWLSHDWPVLFGYLSGVHRHKAIDHMFHGQRPSSYYCLSSTGWLWQLMTGSCWFHCCLLLVIGPHSPPLLEMILWFTVKWVYPTTSTTVGCHPLYSEPSFLTIIPLSTMSFTMSFYFFPMVLYDHRLFTMAIANLPVLGQLPPETSPCAALRWLMAAGDGTCDHTHGDLYMMAFSGEGTWHATWHWWSVLFVYFIWSEPLKNLPSKYW